MHKITVVIPTHNRRDDLKKSVVSIFRQSKTPDELIVIDDGSVPSVRWDIFKGAPDNIKCILIHNKIPQGANNARNQGIKAANGNFIAFLDDDDEFKKNKIELILECMCDYPFVDFFYHPAEIHLGNTGLSYVSRPKKFYMGEDIFKSLLVKNAIGGTPMVIVRKSSLEDVGYFDEEMKSLQDYELWLRLAKSGAVFKLLDVPLTKYNHVVRRKSVSKNLIIHRESIAAIEKKYAVNYADLTKKEIKEFKAWKQAMASHKALLNGNIMLAFKERMKQFFITMKPIDMISALVILGGPTFVYKIKSRIG